ncbi:pectinesterase family protein [Streptomyces sp. NPDC053560]|uniref:pectinesterase family protein n=1 Tax=Streptomyces sp. NPDC053560 TaxID=3365711 RepID=UPI0037D62736
MTTQRDRTLRARKGRHGRRGTGAGWGLGAGVPLGVLVATGLACGGAFGAFGATGAEAVEGTGGAGRTAAAAPARAGEAADGFASVNALGQNGTYGGRDGKTVTVRSLADLEKYATAAEPYVIVVDGAITMDPKGKEIKVASAPLVQRGNVFKGTEGRNESGGAAFDPRTYYPYTLDPAADVPGLVKSGSGPRATLGAKAASAATTLTVAADGSGQYRTVQAAVDAVPSGNTSRTVIAVKPGTYREAVQVPANKPHVTIQGTGATAADAQIVEGRSAGTAKPGGGTYGTSGSATLAVEADDFQLRNLTVSNDFDEAAHQGQEGHQAVALRTAADKVLLRQIVVKGDQDTLLLDTASKDKRGRVYVDRSTVVGNVDFVFGRATAVLDRSVLTLKKRWDGTSAGYVTAPSTAAGNKGFLINDSVVEGGVGDRSHYLGRPWHAGGDATLDPQAVVRNTRLSAAVKTAPWTDMGGFSWKDDRFAEYANTGPGAGPAGADRPQLTDQQATAYEIVDWLGDWTPSAS